MCLLYKSHLEEIKNLQQQDILHILFSKALHCSAVQVILINVKYSSLYFDSNGEVLYTVCVLTPWWSGGRKGGEGDGWKRKERGTEEKEKWRFRWSWWFAPVQCLVN